MSDEAIALRPMLAADIPILAAIFQAAVDELAAEDYDDAQRSVWAAVADDERAFGERLRTALTIVATVRGSAVGFISLAGANKIDLLYVYPRAARNGVASALLNAIEKIAGSRGAEELEVDASDTARHFFEARQFEAVHRFTTALGATWFGATRMRKSLKGVPGA